MLGKWEKIEAALNALIQKIKLFLISCFLKSVPPKFIELFKTSKLKLYAWRELKTQQVKQWVTLRKKQAPEKKEQLKKLLENLKSKLRLLHTTLKNIKNKKITFRIPKRSDLVQLIMALKDFRKLCSQLFWRALWFIKPDQRQYALITLVILVSGLSVLSFYSWKLMTKLGHFREPATIKTQFKNPRPVYYHKYDKTLTIHSVNFPVYIESARSARMLRMDLTITTSNKYTRNYLNSNYHLIQDRLNTMLEPMVPEFPIEEEGKTIIRKKVKDEVEGLINKMKINGKVEKIHIHSILSG